MLSFLLFAAMARALPQPDPYAPPPPGEVQRLALRAAFGGDAAARAIEAWLRRHPAAPAAERAMLAHRLCNNLGVLTGGARRVAACRFSVDLSGDPDDRSDLALAKAFRHAPPLAATGTAMVPLGRSVVGHMTVAIATRTARSAWIVDTGAEVTTIPESTARALGVRRVAGAVDVGTITAIRVQGGMGMIDRLTIGSASIAHLPVLILPDAMLRFPDGSVIPGILGLPALAAFHQVAWLDRGRKLALGTIRPTMARTRRGPMGKRPNVPAVGRFYWHESGVGVALSTPLGIEGVQLDTGANGSQLGASGLALLTPVQRASVIEGDARVGGAGGILAVRQRKIRGLDYRLAGTMLHSTEMDIGSDANEDGRIGSDTLFKLARLSLNFDTMAIEVEAADVR